MNRSASLRLLVGAILATALGCAAAPRQSAPAIDGDWRVAGATLGGQTLPLSVFDDSRLRLAAGRYAFQNDTGQYVLVPGSVPTAIDVRGVRGPNAGRTIPAILRMEGDTLVIAYDLSGTSRPADFHSDPGTQVFLARYVRASPNPR